VVGETGTRRNEKTSAGMLELDHSFLIRFSPFSYVIIGKCEEERLGN
jgi:hypothetical protein